MNRRTTVIAATAAALAFAGVIVSTDLVSGASSADETVFVPITPCRLIDTRAGELTVGPRATKVGADETATFTAWGTGDANSTCDIPSTATAIATNTVAIAPSARSFMTLFPGDVPNPGTANLNYVAGQAPTPNGANIPLSSTGTFNVFNAFGEVHVVIDVNGFYQPSGNIGGEGPTGPTGAAGPQGPAGADGADGDDGADGSRNRMSAEKIVLGQWFDDPGLPALYGVGSNPQDVFATVDKVFVSNFNDDTLSVIDPVANTVTGTISLPASPRKIGFDGTHLYVATNANTVIVVDPMTETTVGAPIVVGSNPAGFGFANGKMYVGTSGSVTVINASTKAVVGTVTTAPTAFHTGFATDGTRMFFGDGQNNDVYVIDTTTDMLVGSPISVDPGPEALAFDGQHIYVASGFFDNTISVIDTALLTVINTFDIGTDIDDMVYDGQYLNVIDETSDSLQIVDLRSQTVAATADLGTGQAGITFNGTNLFVLDSVSELVQKILAI